MGFTQGCVRTCGLRRLRRMLSHLAAYHSGVLRAGLQVVSTLRWGCSLCKSRHSFQVCMQDVSPMQGAQSPSLSLHTEVSNPDWES